MVESVELGALILFSESVRESARFYRALGLPLEEERHGDGPVHFACELGATHFALFEADAACATDRSGTGLGPRDGGAAMPGFAVASLEQALEAVLQTGAAVLQPPREYPWGPRALVADPDGRVVELFERRERT